MRRPWIKAWGLAVSCAALAWGIDGLLLDPVSPRKQHPADPTGPLPSSPSPRAMSSADGAANPERAMGRSLLTPTGAPASLSCDEARRVVTQARAYLASPPAEPDPQPFADALIEWLDPHGLWSAAPDAPIGPLIKKLSPRLLTELETEAGSGRCEIAEEIGAATKAWVGELRAVFDESARGAPLLPRPDAFAIASSPVFQDGPVTRPARELSAELGRRVGMVRRSYGEALSGAAEQAVARALPADTVAWPDVVLAAAVRAYLPQIDPHAGWAPLDEETSLYEVELEASPPPRLWRKMARTAVGIRVDETSASSLKAGEIVLAVGEVATSCLSVEQAEQLAYVDVEGTAPLTRKLQVLGPDDEAPREVDVRVTIDPSQGEERAPGLDSTRLAFGDGSVLVVPIGDVPDHLGDELSATLQKARSEEPKLLGVVLDLRGNGGGSTDGASSALGLFLPGATLFPLRRRDGSVEVERAPEPPEGARWTGPLAVLVDGDTASAAEMIAGAIAAYRRGPVIGDRTYGKGCAQEYLDDDAHVGVLRLTTLVYALPDGSPVQLVGLSPTIRLPMPRAPEREANLAHALPPWRGPDVRDPTLLRDVPWPGHGGSVGPCTDASLCKALRALGAKRTTVARGQAR